MSSANYRPDLTEYGVVIPRDREALETALSNASKPLPGSTALRIYLAEQAKDAAAEMNRRALDRLPTHWDSA